MHDFGSDSRWHLDTRPDFKILYHCTIGQKVLAGLPKKLLVDLTKIFNES